MQDKPQEAVAILQQTVAIVKAAQGEDSPNLANPYLSLGRVYYLQENWPEAEKWLTMYKSIIRNAKLDNSTKEGANTYDTYGIGLGLLAEVYYKEGKLVEAECCAIEGISILKELLELSDIYVTLTKVYYSQGQLLAATEAHTTAISLMKSLPVEYFLWKADKLQTLSDLYRQMRGGMRKAQFCWQ